MSKNTNEESSSANKTDAEGKATPRKRVAKKAATKTAAKATKATTKSAAKAVVDRIETATDATPVVKKAVKKTAAKKVSKKAAQATEISAPPEIAIPAPKKKVARIRKSADAPSASSAPPSESSAPAQDRPQPARPPVESGGNGPTPRSSPAPNEKRFGRVPGGGPRVSRESNDEATAASPQASRDENDRPPQGGSVRNPQNRDGGQASHQGHHSSAQRENNDGQQQRESRSKRRREKRKRRLREAQQTGQGSSGSQGNQGNQGGGNRRDPQNRSEASNSHSGERQSVLPSGPKIEVNGMLELAPKGFGFLRVPQKNFEQARDDVFVTPESIRKFNLRVGQWIHGVYQEGTRGPQLVEISSINGMTPEEASKLPHFDELKAINPTRRISFETTPERFTTRVVDIMAPVGRGQRGLIVSPPRSGKTTLLLHMAEAIRQKYEESIHLMVVLVDERPEEVTEFRRALPGAEIYASSNDEQARNHCRIAELAIERAKRLVEAGKDVFLLMDSITRLARAYNGNMNNRGRGTGSGGITIGALEVPRRLFAAARNTRGGGSLTILATALIQTNSRADEAIFMEFKGTGNMELVLDRKIAENYIYPAVDIFKSGTRREELLIPDHMLHKIHLIRRGLSGHRPVEAMERLLFFLKKFPNNPQMLLEIKG
jgi:transcription termination factor Rho